MNSQPGVSVFLAQKVYDPELRYAMVTNDASRLPSGKLSRLAVLETGVNLVKIFSPEHGIDVKGDDGKFQQSGIDTTTKLPLISLYGAQLIPSEQDLENVDALLFDIPDIGCRFYTYLWTLTYVMEACAANKKKLIVLDRPNPIGGNLSMAEGPWLQPSCSSFIGRWNIPIRHCCTLGELASYFQATLLPHLQLEVVPYQYWKGQNDILENERWFYPTSPAIRDIQTALLYPGTGLWEGVNVQEGRGTSYPFRQMGAPWIDERFADQLKALALPGLNISFVSFLPAMGRYEGEICNGIHLEVTDPAVFKPVATGISLLQQLMLLYPGKVTIEKYQTLANPSGEDHLEKLLGIPNAFKEIQQGNIATDIATEWTALIGPFLLYH